MFKINNCYHVTKTSTLEINIARYKTPAKINKQIVNEFIFQNLFSIERDQS